MNYEAIFRRKQHHITIPQRRSRKIFFGNEHLQKILKHQNSDENVFITKYADDGIVSCIILDLDDAENPKNAFKDARKLQKWTHRKDLNTVIISSGSKGFHTYTQIPFRAFGNEEYSSDVNRDIWFNKFVETIINKRKFKYPTLDEINTSAGLGGNIRVIGSLHPKSQRRCEIVEGEFIEEVIPNEYEWKCFETSHEFAKVHEETKVKKHRAIVQQMQHTGENPIWENDLRTLMPSIFGGEVKSFPKGYIMMTCPFHNDGHPSMVVTKEYYYCKSDSCGAKGNWWTLRKLGYVDFKKEELIRVKKKVKN